MRVIRVGFYIKLGDYIEMTQHVNGLIEKALEGTLWRPGTWKRIDLSEDVIVVVLDCQGLSERSRK